MSGSVVRSSCRLVEIGGRGRPSIFPLVASSANAEAGMDRVAGPALPQAVRRQVRVVEVDGATSRFFRMPLSHATQ